MIHLARSSESTPLSLPLSILVRRAGLGVDLPLAAGNIEVTCLTDDSRRMIAGGAFVAVRGVTCDGHAYLDDALQAGARVLFVELGASVPALGRGVVVLRVSDTRSAAAWLAAAWYDVAADSDRPIEAIGVTGTNGKTTVCFLLRSILRQAGRRPAMVGTIEYDLVGRCFSGPLTTPGPFDLCRHLAEARDHGARSAVMEVSSHALDQRRAEGLRFAVGVFTNLSGDHQDYHDSMESYFAAKRRLFVGSGAAVRAVVNMDDAYGRALAGERAEGALTYGMRASADVTARIVRMDAVGTELVIDRPSGELRVRSHLIGKFNVSNVLAAVATAEVLGIESEAVRRGIEELGGVRGRLERVEPAAFPFRVVVDYAHTDAALTGALSVLAPLTAGRLICVFGCGGDRDRSKRPRMARAAEAWAHHVFVTSDNPRTEDPASIIGDVTAGFSGGYRGRVDVEPDRAAAIGLAVRMAEPGDTVLIAGKGHETYQIVGRVRRSFDDAVVARACIEERGEFVGATG